MERNFGIAMTRTLSMRYGILAAIVASSVLVGAAVFFSTTQSSSALKQSTTITRDTASFLLEGKTIRANSFLDLYDSSPYIIANGHVVMRLPCDTNHQTPFQLLVGHAEAAAVNLVAADTEYIPQLSNPGDLCVYHVDLPVGSNPNTDITLKNTGSTAVTFPAESTIHVGVNEIAPMKGG